MRAAEDVECEDGPRCWRRERARSALLQSLEKLMGMRISSRLEPSSMDWS